jgi:hypothetical protein
MKLLQLIHTWHEFVPSRWGNTNSKKIDSMSLRRVLSLSVAA